MGEGFDTPQSKTGATTSLSSGREQTQAGRAKSVFHTCVMQFQAINMEMPARWLHMRMLGLKKKMKSLLKGLCQLLTYRDSGFEARTE